MTLPAFLSSSYQQYKEDQKVFTTWLYQAAKACGYKSATDTAREAALKAPKVASEVITAPSQRLKGKARKAAKQAGPSAASAYKPSRSVSYMMSTAELIARIRAVAQCTPKKVLPAGIRAVLKRAINARQRCADWYAQSGADVAANAGHRHFIQILVDAANSLSPATNAQAATDTGAKEILDLSNKFDGLEVEDVDEEFPLTAADVSAPSKRITDPRETYDVDDTDMDFDATFQLFCFFEDLHGIQADIQAVWQRFTRGELDLKVAMIVTQAGIDIVQRLELEQRGRTNSCVHHGSKHPHINLALPVFYSEAFMSGEDPDELLGTPKGLEHRPFDDFIYLPTLRTLMKFADMAYKVKDKVAWPFPVPQMRFSYICRPELLEKPGYKEREEDDRILTQLLLDTFVIEDSKQTMKKMTIRGKEEGIAMLPELRDEFSKSSKTLWETGKVSTYAVFTSRVLLDILDICGHSAQPSFACQLRDERERAAATMEFFVDDIGALDTHEVRWLAKDQQLIKDVYRLVEVHIPNKAFPQLKNGFLKEYAANKQHGAALEDLPPEVQAAVRQRMIDRGMDPDDGPTEEHKRNAEKLNLTPIEPSPQEDFLQTHNALHCGFLSLQLTSLLEEAGIALANHHLSIFATAHLYNALHQLGMTELRWPDMERMIDLHTGAIFSNDVPKTPTECLRRIEHRTGFTATSKRFDKQQPWKFRTGAASASLRQLLDSRDSVEHVLTQLEAQIEDHAKPVSVSKSKRHQSGRKRQLTPAQLMSRLQEYLPVVMKDMELNYITLTKTCNTLLTGLLEVLKTELGIDLGPSKEKQAGDSNDRRLLWVVLEVLHCNHRSAAVHEKTKDKSPFKGSIELQNACIVFETFFNTHLAKKPEQTLMT